MDGDIIFIISEVDYSIY